MTDLAAFCRQCIHDYGVWQAQEDARAQQLQQIAGVTLGQGRRGHAQYMRTRRHARSLGPKFWASAQTRALQEDAAVRLHTSTSSKGW